MRPPQIIALVFLAIILLGSALLCLPAASKRGEPTDFLTSLFTATSATCVTGLVRVDTGTYWSGFGQAVILVAQALSFDQISGVVGLVRNVLLGTLAVEGAGALILTLRFWPEFGLGRAVWYGVFHSVSAYCNAGFDVLGDLASGVSLCGYVDDPVVNLTIM